MPVRFTLSALALVTLAGCATQSPEPRFSMKNSSSLIQQEAQLIEQANALQDISQDILRKSTMNGALIGAAAGCALSLVSASNAKACVGGIVAGGAVGAVVGHHQGQQEIARRKNLVSPSALVRSIGKADDRMDRVTIDLKTTLDRQDAELAQLSADVKSGSVSQQEYDSRRAAIRGNRAEMAEALTLTADQARSAHQNLESAKQQGQSGLEWHLNATRQLEREATSARSSISLL